MANPKASIFAKYLNLFRWTVEDISQGEDDNPFADEEVSVLQRGKTRVAEKWDQIRDMTTRGNAAGAIAALTMIGSGHIAGSPLGPWLFGPLCVF